MAVFGVIAIFLSILVLGAHVMRLGGWVPASIVLALWLLLLIPRRWAARLLQVVLVLAAIEWFFTMIMLVDQRMKEGRPWTRMAIILGAVALWTLFSAAAFRTPGLARRYGLVRPSTAQESEPS